MNRHRPDHPSAKDRFMRLAALACAGLVMMLSLLAVSPDAHALLHEGHGESASPAGPAAGGEPGDCAGGHEAANGHSPALPANDAGCVVTLFSHGVPVLLDLPALPAVERVIEAVIARSRDVVLIAAERHLRPPAHAPPRA